MSDTRAAPVRNGRPLIPYELLRNRLDRRRRFVAIASAILLHLLIVLGFYIADRIRIRDIGEWSGPVLVKIGVPDAPDSPRPDPGPLPDVAETPDSIEPEPVLEPPPVPELTSTPVPEPTVKTAAVESPASQPAPESKPAAATERTVQPSAQSSPSPPVVAAPQPSRVRGSEQGNSYEMNFDGTEDEVGRAGAYEFITSYMPLPEVIDAELFNNAKDYLGMSSVSVRAELERYWEPVFGEYVKKKGKQGIVPLADRPYYWTLITKSLGYNIQNADWRTSGMRPVVVEFTVGRSQGSVGAELSDFKLLSRTNDPRIDEAVIYGLSRWVYYNDTGKTVRGRITYNFDR